MLWCKQTKEGMIGGRDEFEAWSETEMQRVWEGDDLLSVTDW